MDANFEFDPDNPPEIRAPNLVFHAVTDTDFECWVRITEPAACGEGYYRMQGGEGTVVFDIHDCEGIADAYEAQHATSNGYLRMDTLHAGDTPGNFSGEPLETTMAGYVSVETSPEHDQDTPWTPRSLRHVRANAYATETSLDLSERLAVDQVRAGIVTDETASSDSR